MEKGGSDDLGLAVLPTWKGVGKEGDRENSVMESMGKDRGGFVDLPPNEQHDVAPGLVRPMMLHAAQVQLPWAHQALCRAVGTDLGRSQWGRSVRMTLRACREKGKGGGRQVLPRHLLAAVLGLSIMRPRACLAMNSNSRTVPHMCQSNGKYKTLWTCATRKTVFQLWR